MRRRDGLAARPVSRHLPRLGPVALAVAVGVMAALIRYGAFPAAGTPPGRAAPAGEVAPAEAPPADAPPADTPAPSPRLVLSQTTVDQGGLAVLTVLPPPGYQLAGARATGWNPAPQFFRLGEGYTGLVAAPYETRPGTYRVDVSARLKGGRNEALTAPGSVELTVRYKRFTESRIYVDQRTSDLRYDPQGGRDLATIIRIRSRSNPEPLWHGPFLRPAAGEVTTQFGEIEYVNDVEDGRHSGVDIANEEGTPVAAANDGVVVLAQKLVMTGNTVIIDHGLGVFSSYSHLSAMSARTGDTIARGQVIGRMGSTGFSTGSHLHWNVTVGSTPTDPWPLVSDGLLGR